jgi:hypothetical protein
MQNPVKNGDSRTVTSNFGDGPHVDVTYTSSNTSLLTVNAVGKVVCIADPSQSTKAYVYAQDENGLTIQTFEFTVYPSNTTLHPGMDSSSDPWMVGPMVAEET